MLPNGGKSLCLAYRYKPIAAPITSWAAPITMVSDSFYQSRVPYDKRDFQEEFRTLYYLSTNIMV